MPKAETKNTETLRNPESIKVGNLVHWYQHGERGSEPVAAIVTRVNPNNASMAELSLIRQGFTALEPTDMWIRHIDDPFFDEHRNHAVENGAWDFVTED